MAGVNGKKAPTAKAESPAVGVRGKDEKGKSQSPSDSGGGARWKNRIVGGGLIDPKKLTPNEMNWRQHSGIQQEVLEGALDTVGWVQDVIVNKRTGHIVDGHLRVAIALQRGELQVPYKLVDLSEKEEKLVLATFDPIGAMASADAEKLHELLEGVDVQNRSIQQMLTDMQAEITAASRNIPSLDDLEEKYGQTEDSAFWPVIRLQVPQEAFDLYVTLMSRAPGDDEVAKFTAILRVARKATTK